MKKYLALLLMTLILISLAACSTTRHTTNVYRSYRDFLSYSLGEYEIIEERTRRVTDGPIIGSSVEYRIWELEYERQNGEVSVFQFNNRSGSIAWDFIRHAEEIVAEDLMREIINDSFEPASLRDITVLVQIQGAIPWEERDRSFTRELDSQTGLRLYSVTPQELLDDWNATIRVEARGYYDHGNYMSTIESLEAVTRVLADYLELDRIEVRFALFMSRQNLTPRRDVSFHGYYNRETDTFEIQTDREALDAQQEASAP